MIDAKRWRGILAGIHVTIRNRASLAFAWGDRGHRLVGAIARDVLSDRARMEIAGIHAKQVLAKRTR